MTVAKQIHDALSQIKAQSSSASLLEGRLINRTLDEAFDLLSGEERAEATAAQRAAMDAALQKLDSTIGR